VTEATVLCYGELGVDNLIQVPHLPSPERAAFPTTDDYHVGGAAANTAIWLAAWGVPVRLAGNALGRDDLGDRLWAWLSAYPTLDLGFIDRQPGLATPFCRILITPDGERTILVYGYPLAPKTRVTPGMLAGAAYLALDLYGGEERLEAAQAAHRAGLTTVVSDLIDPDHPVLPWVDILIVSSAYLRSEHPGVDPQQRAKELRQVCQGAVILTDGPRPVHALDRDGRLLSLQPPSVQPVDTTGAGDAFRAGLIYGLRQGRELAECLPLAAAAGALKITASGGEVAPMAEVSRLAASLRIVE
jgi:sugar/nucleoside kinase (ribokinase family)